jgi:hypothetical protein
VAPRCPSPPNWRTSRRHGRTCRAQDLERFVALGLGLVRIRGSLADLEIARTDRDFFPQRCLLAAAGVPFYGYAAMSRDLVAVVFAADGHQHFEAPAGAGRHPAAHLLSNSGLPYGAELYLGRHYYRCLASTLATLPDTEPWLPAMPKELADAMACECGGRGWFLAEEEDTGRCVICRCDICSLFPNDVIAGRVAYGSIETGWPE